VYYIFKHLPSEKKDLPEGTRILKLPIKLNIFRFGESVEGPFNDCQTLKRNSNIYKELIVNEPKRAEKIFKDEYVVDANEFVLYRKDSNPAYEKCIFKIIQHCVNGRIIRNDVLGVHLFYTDRIRIIEIINPENSKGIWEAKIEVFNIMNNKWIPKDRTTFFPRSWTLQQLIIECQIAFMNKIKISEKRYKGYTKNNIPVIFVLDEYNELLTVYPLYE